MTRPRKGSARLPSSPAIENDNSQTIRSRRRGKVT